MTTSDIRSLETFRDNYNNIIPHSSISMEVPAKRYLETQKWKDGDDLYMEIEKNNSIRRVKVEIKIP